jgi:Phosphodiester glycosidase/FlgD Ig-like domain
VVGRGLTVVVLVTLAVLALPGVADAWKRTRILMPGVRYTKEVRWVYGGPLVTHVIKGPRHGGLHKLRPVLSSGTVLGRKTLSSMQRRELRRANVAGVNGDFFNLATGHPSGMFMRDGVLATRPESSRSSLGIAFDGTLRVGRIDFVGSWSAAGFPRHRLRELNRPLTDPGVALFTPQWGGPTPRLKRVFDVVLAGLPPTVANGSFSGRVVGVRRGGGTVVPRGGAVLQARGDWRPALRREARLGRDVTVGVRLTPQWPDVADAIGGGPALVRRGRPIFDAGEGFTSGHLAFRHPRTAVGQRASGRTILVAVDGRSSASMGVPTWELALEMVRLGAVTAVSLDGGGSTTMAFNGRVLNDPSDGAERPVAEGLMIFYYGIYAPQPRARRFSPNGDGVSDVQTLRAKIVRPSWVDVRLVRPDGRVGWRYRGHVRRGTITRRLDRASMREGRWRWIVRAREELRGYESRMRRSFVVNNTLGFLRLSKTRMRVVRHRGGRLDVSFVLTRRSRVAISVRSSTGRRVRRLARELAPATVGWTWDGRRANGSVVRGGRYTVRVRARNKLGTVALARSVRVVRR